MESTDTTVRLVKVTTETFIDFLRRAKDQIVIAKAGYFKGEVEAILSLSKEKKTSITLFVEPGEQAVRFGLGDADSLLIIKDHMRDLDVREARHIRMSVAIVDDTALIFSPVALAWETEPEEPTYPNGLICGKAIAGKLRGQFLGDSGKAPAKLPGNVVPLFQDVVIPKTEKKDVEAQIAETVKKLKENPPADPSRLRQITFYRNQYKLLRMQVWGVKIGNKTISLRPFTSILPQMNKRLRNSWQVFTKEEVATLRRHKKFLENIESVKDEFTVDTGRYGNLLPVSRKREFEAAIQETKAAFVQGLSRSEEGLARTLANSREKLLEYMRTLAVSHKACWPMLFKNDRALYKMLQREEISEREALRRVLESFITDVLRFPSIASLLESVAVVCDYYDISSELLADEEFMAMLKDRGLESSVRAYEKGYEDAQQRA